MDEWRARVAAGDESPLRDNLIIGTDRRRTERP